MTLPETMEFIATDGAGGPEVMRLARGPVPQPRAGELLVRVQAAGVNRPDVLQRQGRYPLPPDASPIMGLEIAGTVTALGAGVTGWQPGQRVCALTNGGGYAEYCVVPAPQCLPWPDGTDALQAAAIPETYFTVWANVFGHGRLAPGESLLVHGGSSGIGTTAIQLAHALGATVYATVGNAEKAAACLRLGAAAAIEYRTQDFLAELRGLTGGRGVDVVLDMVGAPYFARNLAALAMDGRLVQIAFLQGSKVEGLDLAQVMQRRLVITGSTMRPRSTAQKGAIAAELHARVWPLLAAGRCHPLIHATFPLAEAAAAHALMESGAHIGKIVLQVAP